MIAFQRFPDRISVRVRTLLPINFADCAKRNTPFMRTEA